MTSTPHRRYREHRRHRTWNDLVFWLACAGLSAVLLAQMLTLFARGAR